MLFCEECRVKKNWPRLPGYPQIGWASNVECEICRVHTDCHDIPSSMLKPEKLKTTEEKLVDRAMEDGYHMKADSLAVYNLNGRLNSQLTESLQKVFVGPETKPNWYSTYLLRLKLQRQIRLSEERNRDRR